MRKRIVLVEDNMEMRENTAEILELAGIRCLPPPNGKEGVKAVQSEMPDLVICDIMMPQLDGTGCCTCSAKTQKRPPFLLFSDRQGREKTISGKA